MLNCNFGWKIAESLQRVASVLQSGAVLCSASSTSDEPAHGSPCIPLMAHRTTSTALQHTAAHCNTLQHTATHCNTLQHTATHCSPCIPLMAHRTTSTALQHMQHTATHCNTLQPVYTTDGAHTTMSTLWKERTYCVLQCVAVWCSPVQCVGAVHCRASSSY